MEKILDSSVRKTLFDNLKEAGFSKDEAAKIVSDKYKNELNKETLKYLSNIYKLFEEEKYGEISENAFDFTAVSGIKDFKSICNELERINQLTKNDTAENVENNVKK